MNIRKITQIIQKNKRFLISTHVNPDPDAICSEMAMSIYLRALGKKVTVVNEEATPQKFGFLPKVNQIKAYRRALKTDYDVAIILDCGNLDRIGKVQTLIPKGCILVNIDHHLFNAMFGAVNIVNPKSSSTAEVLFELFKKVKFKLTKDMGLHLYSGIMTDTGSFRYENTNARTHEITSELRKFSFSADQLYQKFYESIPLKDMKALMHVMDHFDSAFGGKVLYVTLRKTTLSKFSKAFDLRDSIFKWLRSICGVEAFIIFTEGSPKETRVNLRSAGRVNVAKVAHSFDGGGHHNASGCTLGCSIKKAQTQVLAKIKKAL